jgi:hypothetical protein
MMTIADYVFVHVQRLQTRRDHPHGNQPAAVDPAGVVFPLLADINQQKFFTGLAPTLQFGNGNFQFAHWYAGAFFNVPGISAAASP